jgi:hypothetical protein
LFAGARGQELSQAAVTRAACALRTPDFTSRTGSDDEGTVSELSATPQARGQEYAAAVVDFLLGHRPEGDPQPSLVGGSVDLKVDRAPMPPIEVGEEIFLVVLVLADDAHVGFVPGEKNAGRVSATAQGGKDEEGEAEPTRSVDGTHRVAQKEAVQDCAPLVAIEGKVNGDELGSARSLKYARITTVDARDSHIAMLSWAFELPGEGRP